MKTLTTASEYPYAYVVGQKVRFKPLLSTRMVEAYIIRLPDDNNALVKTRDGRQVKVKLERLFADASLYPKQPYEPLTMKWSEWLLQKIPLRRVDPFLCEAIWHYVNHHAFQRRMVQPPILVEKQPGFIKGRFYPDRKMDSFGTIAVDPAGRFGLNGLASVIAHEAVHQWQARIGASIDHEQSFVQFSRMVTQKTGIKIVIKGDDISDAEFEVGINEIEADHDVFYLFVREYPGMWKAGASENANIAMHAYEAFAHGINEVHLFRSRNLALVKLMNDLDNQVKVGDDQFRLDYAPMMLLEYAQAECQQMKYHTPHNMPAR